MQMYVNNLKKHAMGNFGDFLKDVSRQPSMLKYLNGRQNRKASPNENFARELLELFTLGEGQYTEKDVREAARAFTGYSHNFNGDFIFRRFQHDSGQKTFFGATENFNGDDIIDRILKEKQCARFVCTKVYRYFVNPVPNQLHIDELTEVFYKDYNISRLMRYLFVQDWFYGKEHRGVKIKSPIDLLSSMYRIWPYSFSDEMSSIKIQKILGQSLLEPPNVAGWPGDKNWIDTNTLMVRLKLPSLLYKVDLQNGSKNAAFKGSKRHPLAVKCDASYMERHYKSYDLEQLLEYILGDHSSLKLEHYCSSNTSKTLTTARLMSLPEFQMA
jgi:uncharacterized protein (DUF1800 family)